MKCKFCGKKITQNPKSGSWRLYGFLAGLLTGSQYRCGENTYEAEMIHYMYNDFEGIHEPDNSEVSKVTEILLKYD